MSSAPEVLKGLGDEAVVAPAGDGGATRGGAGFLDDDEDDSNRDARWGRESSLDSELGSFGGGKGGNVDSGAVGHVLGSTDAGGNGVGGSTAKPHVGGWNTFDDSDDDSEAVGRCGCGCGCGCECEWENWSHSFAYHRDYIPYTLSQ